MWITDCFIPTMCYNHNMKKDKRGSYWKKIPKEERSRIMSENSLKRWAKTTKKERSEIGRKMNEKRWNKKP